MPNSKVTHSGKSNIEMPNFEVSNSNFQDILHLPHFHAPNKPYLSSEKRAAQFMSFKSLDTYEDVIEKKIQILKDQSLDPIIDYHENQSFDLDIDYSENQSLDPTIDYSESQENTTSKNNTAFF